MLHLFRCRLKVFSTQKKLDYLPIWLYNFLQKKMSAYLVYMKYRKQLFCYDQKFVSVKMVCHLDFLEGWAHNHSIIFMLYGSNIYSVKFFTAPVLKNPTLKCPCWSVCPWPKTCMSCTSLKVIKAAGKATFVVASTTFR